MKKSILFAAVVAFIATASVADAKAGCRDAKGKFIKCPQMTAAPAATPAKAKPKQCRDAKGHFAKCGTLGVK